MKYVLIDMHTPGIDFHNPSEMKEFKEGDIFEIDRRHVYEIRSVIINWRTKTSIAMATKINWSEERQLLFRRFKRIKDYSKFFEAL